MDMLLQLGFINTLVQGMTAKVSLGLKIANTLVKCNNRCSQGEQEMCECLTRALEMIWWKYDANIYQKPNLYLNHFQPNIFRIIIFIMC